MISCTRPYTMTVAAPVNPLHPYDFTVTKVSVAIIQIQLKILTQSPQPIVRCYRSSDSGANWVLMTNFFTTIATVGSYKLQQVQVGGTGVGGFPGTNALDQNTEYWWRWQLDDGSIMPGHVVQRMWPYNILLVEFASILYCSDCNFLPDGTFPSWDGKAPFNGTLHSNSFYLPYQHAPGAEEYSNMQLFLVNYYKPGGAADPNWSLLLQCDGGTTFLEAAKDPVQTDILNPATGTYLVTNDPCTLVGIGNPLTIVAV